MYDLHAMHMFRECDLNPIAGHRSYGIDDICMICGTVVRSYLADGIFMM